MNNIVAALGLTVLIVLIISVFNSHAGQFVQLGANSTDSICDCQPCECIECNITEPTESECPEDTTPYAACNSCCEPCKCPICEDCIECEECEYCVPCDSCCEPCPSEANEENCQKYCDGEDKNETIEPKIIFIQCSGEDVLDEWVLIEGTGTDITNWTLSDLANHTYTFSEFVINGSVFVHTGSGENNETDVFWGSGTAIWNNGGDTATLRNENGDVINTYEY